MFYRKILSKDQPKRVQTFRLFGSGSGTTVVFSDDWQSSSDPREWDEELREMSLEDFHEEFADHPARQALVDLLEAQEKAKR